MDDVVDCERVSKACGSIAVVMVEKYSEVDHISTQWMHCVNSANHSMMPSLSLILLHLLVSKTKCLGMSTYYFWVSGFATLLAKKAVSSVDFTSCWPLWILGFL